MSSEDSPHPPSPTELWTELCIAVVNADLSSGKKCKMLTDTMVDLIQANGHDVDVHALDTWNLPPCDGRSCYQHEATMNLSGALSEADAIVLIAPIYNYDLNAAAKNLIELTGSAWKGKAVGLVCVAGGGKSYLAPLSFLNSLSIDHRCLVSPRYVYVSGSDFSADGTLPSDGDIQRRLTFLAREIPVLASAARQIAAIPRD